MGGAPKIGRPIGLGPLSGDGIHSEPILALPVLSPFLNSRPSRVGILPKLPYLIYYPAIARLAANPTNWVTT